MNNNFMAVLKTCDKCGEKYLEAHCSAECPHERLVDLMDKPDRLLEEIKGIARSMLTASHYNSLPKDAFEDYLKEIIAKTASIYEQKIAEIYKKLHDIMKESGDLRTLERNIAEFLKEGH